MLSKPFVCLVISVVSLNVVHMCGAPFHLFDYGFNVEGAVALAPSDALSGVDDSGFDYSTGLGTVVMSAFGSGPHYLGLFVDHEIDESINTFFNEYGKPVSGPSASQTWEIDEPGYTFGNLLENFQSKELDNSSGISNANPDDVSMAMAWRIGLDAGERALVTFQLSDEVPTDGFYLQHIDPDSDKAIYFCSALRILPRATIPDSGATWALMLVGLASLAVTSRVARGRHR